MAEKSAVNEVAVSAAWPRAVEVVIRLSRRPATRPARAPALRSRTFARAGDDDGIWGFLSGGVPPCASAQIVRRATAMALITYQAPRWQRGRATTRLREHRTNLRQVRSWPVSSSPAFVGHGSYQG